MARHPDWFGRLDSIIETVRQAETLEWFGRNEIKAAFGCSERDSIRLLHKFGAAERDDVLSLPRSDLLIQLEALRTGSTYAAFFRQRQGVAKQINAARSEAAARQLVVRRGGPGELRRLEDLPGTIRWRRSPDSGCARFEIVYVDGADLMRQIADFLAAAAAEREEFFSGTEPAQ
jgi:hypothetical protein